ncbi:MAG TPA: hypothetical protein VHB21_16600, partial [Minicystis sp.]|nr:hypothetical protein [Minicystis sp.]
MSDDAPLDLDWVRPCLAIGSRWAIGDVARLAREHGVRHAVDVRAECCDDAALLDAHGVSLLSLPTEDNAAIAADAIDLGVGWIGARLARDERVLVHCEHGIGRSALLVLCVLVAGGAPPLGALAELKRARAPI